MKALELAESPLVNLTWDNVLGKLREEAPHGCTIPELAGFMGADSGITRDLLRVMFEAGAVARVKLGEERVSALLFFDRSVAS